MRAWMFRALYGGAFLLMFSSQMGAPNAQVPNAVIAGALFSATTWMSVRAVMWLSKSVEASFTALSPAQVGGSHGSSAVSVPSWDRSEKVLTTLVLRVHELSLRSDLDCEYPGVLDREHCTSRAFLDFYDEAILRHSHGDRAEEVLFTHAVEQACRLFAVARHEARGRSSARS